VIHTWRWWQPEWIPEGNIASWIHDDCMSLFCACGNALRRTWTTLSSSTYQSWTTLRWRQSSCPGYFAKTSCTNHTCLSRPSTSLLTNVLNIVGYNHGRGGPDLRHGFAARLLRAAALFFIIVSSAVMISWRNHVYFVLHHRINCGHDLTTRKIACRDIIFGS
jgi:hypothetical protein